MAMLLILISSCAPTPEVRPVEPKPELYGPDSVAPGLKQNTAPPIEERLRAVVGLWTGTPHKMGGDSRRGIDCSGFVRRVYREVLGIRLPRTTSMQVQVGKVVNINELRIGDLVFFKPPYKIRHVGIYLGYGEFAHASTSKGVTISMLNNPYWRDAFWTAKRLLLEKI